MPAQEGARRLGVRKNRKPFKRRFDSRALSRHSPGRGLSSLSGPHREGDIMAGARCRKKKKGKSDRKICDVAGGERRRGVIFGARWGKICHQKKTTLTDDAVLPL